MELTTTSIITAIASNKQEVKRFVENVKLRFDEMSNPEKLQFYGQLKMAEKAIKDLTTDDDIDSMLLDAADEWNKEELKDLYGCKFEQREVGTKYDYSVTNDSTLFELEQQKKESDEKIKSRQKMLQNLPSEPIYNDEGVQLSRPSKSSKTKLVTTIK